MMMRISNILLVIVLCVSVRAAHKHHPKFRRAPLELESVSRPVDCMPEHKKENYKMIQKSMCGEPKEVFVPLTLVAHKEVIPGAVWVKRCVGLCQYTKGSKCVPTAKQKKAIHVRVFNAKTNQESCEIFEVEEHLSCGCCPEAGGDCAPPHVFDPPQPNYEVEFV